MCVRGHRRDQRKQGRSTHQEESFPDRAAAEIGTFECQTDTLQGCKISQRANSSRPLLAKEKEAKEKQGREVAAFRVLVATTCRLEPGDTNVAISLEVQIE